MDSNQRLGGLDEAYKPLHHFLLYYIVIGDRETFIKNFFH